MKDELDRGEQQKGPQPYMSPYWAGIGLGVTLLASILLMGRGLGASGAMTRVTGYLMDNLLGGIFAAPEYMHQYLNADNFILNEYLVYMFLGIFIGGFVSGAFAGRVKLVVEKGANMSTSGRLVLAFSGGMISAWGARLARGCTSGQALTGGATLSVGSWLFIVTCFAGGYGVAWFVRKQWH